MTHILPEPTYARTVRRPPALSSATGLVLAHGAGGSAQANYGAILDDLSTQRTVVAVDYPGSGQTASTETPLSADHIADQLVAAADAEGLGTFAVAGWSLGTAVAIRAATRHPDRVSALVLTSGFAYADARLRLAATVWRDLYNAGDHVVLLEYLMVLARGTDALEAMSPQQQHAAAQSAAKFVPAGTPAQADLVGRIDVRDDLGRINAPTLVISTTGDLLVSPALHRELVDEIPGAEYAELRTGHLVFLEKAPEWAGLITSFLDKHVP